MNTVFDKLRATNPQFIYKSFDLQIDGNEVSATFHFYQSEDIQFFPNLKITLPTDRKFVNLQPGKLQAAVFSIGMIELISYWKACASPEIVIEAGYLNEDQLAFWREVYYQGLGEYLYLNQISVPKDELFTLSVKSQTRFNKEQFVFQAGNIIPIGGGKDSVVSLQTMTDRTANYCFLLNPVQAAKDTAQVAGFSADRTILVRRKLDPRLLELNSQGYLNGHTPFSALLAFVTALAAIIYECKNIVLSNENSASEGNVIYNEMVVNHQYSKSFDAEKRLHNYLVDYICSDLNYFSLLRPLYELQIAALFARHPQYQAIFRSCNKGSKQNIWCCSCSKCLFVYLILSPFVEEEQLKQIFGQDLLNKGELLTDFKALIGLEESKPFDCVGTFLEVKIATAMLLQQYYNDHKSLPLLLLEFERLFAGKIEALIAEGRELLASFNTENLLSAEYVDLLKSQFPLKTKL